MADSTTSIQTRIDAAEAVGGNTVTLSPGTYRTSAPLRIRTVQLLGSGPQATTLVNDDSDVFTPEGSHWAVGVMTVIATAGHVFAPVGAGNGQCIVRDLILHGAPGPQSLWYQEDGTALIDARFRDCEFWMHAQAEQPAWYIRSTGGVVQRCTWADCRLNNKGAPHPFFHIESRSPHHMHGLSFERLTGEVCTYGLIHLYSPNKVTIRNVLNFDSPVPYAGDLIRIGQTTGLPPMYCDVRHSGRVGNVLSPGVHDLVISGGAGHVVQGVGAQDGTRSVLLPATGVCDLDGQSAN